MTRTMIEKLHNHIDEEVTIAGWIDIRRDHGKLAFFDIRDGSGIVQSVVTPKNEEAYEAAQPLRNEWVVQVSGLVKKRPQRMVNADQTNGDIELEIRSITVLNESKTPPFEINEDTSNVDENLRLKYRYLDLRTKRMQKNIRLRSEFVRRCREFLFVRDFTEIETPLLTETTEEGSRDFVVPSRLNKGAFYALPQSPQQYKELLMTAGFEKYFQIARAIRDEDLRADRGFEHSQIDIELSFVEREDVMNLTEEMLVTVLGQMGYTFKETPFPRISYKDAMKQHGADKFDLRTEEEKEAGVLAFAWVVDFPQFEKTDDGQWTFSHNPFSMPKDESRDDHRTGENVENILSTQYDLVCNGFETGGGSIRAHTRDILEGTYKIMGYSDEKREKMVGHMLEAYDYGTPPHGGIALGIERLVMTLTGEEALREVQAFPMTRGGQTAVMSGPSPISDDQLDELGLKIIKQDKEKE